MKERVYPAKEVYPNLVDRGNKFFVIHVHIESDFDKSVCRPENGDILKGVPGFQRDLVFINKEILDSDKHEVVSGSKPGLNQAENWLCEAL